MDKPIENTSATKTLEEQVESSITRKPGRRRRKKTNPRKRTDAVNRSSRPFPASSFEEPLQFAKTIFSFGSGQPVRRLTLFDHLGKSPESGGSRQIITNANKYGLIKGNYKADQLELTADGRKAADETLPARESARMRAKLAIEGIPPFNGLYQKLTGNRLPATPALIDLIQELGVSKEFAEEGVDTFVVNLRIVGLLKTLSGAERVVPLDHLLDSLPTSALSSRSSQSNVAAGGQVITQERAHFETTCFYISPIGHEGSEQRKHSDLFLSSIIEPALDKLGLSVVRADAIDKPGIITRQIMEYILKSRIVVADLSFHNPNVFYELALRHATKLPIVQIIRSCEAVPFDVVPMRTVVIDTTDIYSLVPKIDVYRAEVANHVRRAMDNAEVVETPISTYFPQVRLEIANS